MKKNEIGGTCGTYRVKESCIQGFDGETWGKETTWKTQAQMEGNIKMYLQEITCKEWTGLIWLKAETIGELLLTRSWKFVFSTMQDIA